MITSIQKWGNSQGVRLPKSILAAAGFSGAKTVTILAESDCIVIRKVEQRKHKNLRELFEGYDGEIQCTEWDTGTPVGKEIG